MEGKGWFLIYGLLAAAVVYLFVLQQSQAGKLTELQADVAQLRNEAQTTTEVTASPEPKPDAADLSTSEGRDTKRKEDLTAIAAGLTAFREEKNAYPKALQELVPSHLEAVPTDPQAPRLSYRYQRTQSGFRLTCYLETNGDPDDQESDGKQDRIYTVTEKSQ